LQDNIGPKLLERVTHATGIVEREIALRIACSSSLRDIPRNAANRHVRDVSAGTR
jgi:hypothetical protein